MEPAELLHLLAEKLEAMGLTYFVAGSLATIVYGEPRFTNDIDVVVDIPLERAAAFCAAFPGDEFYVSLDAALEAIRTRFPFNILHPKSGLKIDVILPADTALAGSGMARRRQVQAFSEKTVSFASPEDVILHKLTCYKEGGSEKHLRDIAGVLRVQGDRIDAAYLAEWAGRLGLQERWQEVVKRIQEPGK